MGEKRARDPADGVEKASKKSKHEGESKEERRARKEAKKAKKAAKETPNGTTKSTTKGTSDLATSDDAAVAADSSLDHNHDGPNGAAVTTAMELDDDDKPALVAEDAVKADSAKKAAEMVALIKSMPEAMVPFANPMADEKTQKRVFRTVKRSAKHDALKRGVKEVVKALRKSPLPSTGPTAGTHASNAPGIVILAADISPMDVISHIPVLCEDHGIPYIYVPSRAELGAAGATKRPTSVVMVVRDVSNKKMKAKTKKGKDGEGDKEGKEEKTEAELLQEWKESYDELLKVVEKAGRTVRI